MYEVIYIKYGSLQLWIQIHENDQGRLVDDVLVILRLNNDLIDGSRSVTIQFFAMSQSRPRRYDEVFIFRKFISSFFFYPKQTTKQLFHCRTQDAKFTGNSKVVDREFI